MIEWKSVENGLPEDKSYSGEKADKILVIIYRQYVHEAYFFGEEGWMVDGRYYGLNEGAVTHWAELNMPQ